MATTYIQLKLTISPLESGQEIALAFLGEMGFESFVETTEGLEAYIQEESWTPDLLDQLYPLVENGLDIGWS
jgi:ribosomal protein L11 methyltransferase